MLSWSWRSIKLLLLHLVGFHIYFTYIKNVPSSSVLDFWNKPVLKLLDRPVYTSTNIVSLRFHSRKEKYSARFKKFSFRESTKWRKSGSVCTFYRPVIRLFIHVCWVRLSLRDTKSTTHKQITNQTNTPPSDSHGQKRQAEEPEPVL
jgi:hypothetical protein